MAFTNIFISKPSQLSIKNKQLIIRNEDGDNTFVAEDINCILLENLQSNITTYAMQYLANNNVAVFVCDEKHLPCAYLIPYNSYYRPLPILQKQMEIPLPLKNELWNEIIITKVSGQAEVLKQIGCDNSPLLENLNFIVDGDKNNIEATSAQYYFKHLLQCGRRDNDAVINDCLNYGYSLARGLISRSLTANGLIPFIGLHHKSTLNNNNLADDCIEVFRPFIDLFVYSLKPVELDSQTKRRIFSLLLSDVILDGNHYSFSYAIELFVQSLKKSIVERKNLLKLPTLCEITMHYYE